MNPEEDVIRELKKAGASIALTLPCDRVKALHMLMVKEFFHVPLTSEEEGVGISAGAALAGLKPVMLIQSSGLGNMVNALASLSLFYELPLFLLVSWRGVYKETIAAQRPMGLLVPRLLEAMGIECIEIERRDEIQKIASFAKRAFEEGRVKAPLLNPKVWEGSTLGADWDAEKRIGEEREFKSMEKLAMHTRYEILNGVREGLWGKAVVCNLGVPAKELYHACHQSSNFYMLGSMGMATPIGLGIALGSQKEVVVIDGDGSLLMNPGTLATVAEMATENLSILAIDNAAHGSTGNQPTATKDKAQLEMLARAMGIKNTAQSTLPVEVMELMHNGRGPRFVHIIAKPGNANVGEIPLTPQKIKQNVMGFLR